MTAAIFPSPPPSVHLLRSAKSSQRFLSTLPSRGNRPNSARLRLVALPPRVCNQEVVTTVNRSLVSIEETASDVELMAAVQLRIRTFYEFRESYGIEDHKRNVADREFEALKARIAGKTLGFRRVACINATLPLSNVAADSLDLISKCKFSDHEVERVVVGTLDLNQCLKLADELIGKRPEGVFADITRAYISNLCVAEELQRNGLGYALINKAKEVAQLWGISDLYVHVAMDNEAAKKLYVKSGFTYESEEQAWQARFLGREKRLLLWTDLRGTGKST